MNLVMAQINDERGSQPGGQLGVTSMQVNRRNRRELKSREELAAWKWCEPQTRLHQSLTERMAHSHGEKSIIRGLNMKKPHPLLYLNPGSSRMPSPLPHPHSYPPETSSLPFWSYWARCPSMDYSTVYFYCRSPHVQYDADMRCKLWLIYPIWIHPGPPHKQVLVETIYYSRKSRHHAFLCFTSI